MGAILRMIGMDHGYYTNTDWQEAMRIDWIVESFVELVQACAEVHFDIAMTKKAKKQGKFAAILTKFRPFLKAAEKQLKHLDTKFIAAERVTIADACMVSLIRTIFQNPKFVASPYAEREFVGGDYPKLVEYSVYIQ